MGVEFPQKFTVNTTIAYLAEKHGLNKKQIKELFDSFFELVEQGMFTGNRVPLGTIGKIYTHMKPATKERSGVSPATGEPITIKAKPATLVPKFSFTKNFKEKVKTSSA